MGWSQLTGVLDTSALLAGHRERLPGEFAISVVTVADLHFGVLVTRHSEERARRLTRLALVEKLFEPLPVDAAVARSYGHLAAAVAAVGRQPRVRAFDLLIAATAHAHGARLYTRNFEDLRGLHELVEVVDMNRAVGGRSLGGDSALGESERAWLKRTRSAATILASRWE